MAELENKAVFCCLPGVINRSLIVTSCAVFKCPCHRLLSRCWQNSPAGEKRWLCTASVATFIAFTPFRHTVYKGFGEFSLSDGLKVRRLGRGWVGGGGGGGYVELGRLP